MLFIIIPNKQNIILREVYPLRMFCEPLSYIIVYVIKKKRLRSVTFLIKLYFICGFRNFYNLHHLNPHMGENFYKQNEYHFPFLLLFLPTMLHLLDLSL